MNSWLAEFDRRIVVLVASLLVLGAVLVHGASAYDPGTADPGSVGALPAHLVRIGVALVACLFVSQIDYRLVARYAEVGVVLSVAALLMVEFGAFAFGNAGIDRWLDIAGVPFQPAEFAKIFLVLALPSWIDRDPGRLRGPLRSWAPIVAMPLVVGGLIAAQPNFGSALALCLIVATILWVGGMPLRWVTAGATAIVGAAWLAFTHHPKLITRAEAWRNVFLREQTALDADFQSFHAVMGMGNGGLFGVRAGEGITRFAFVPESDTDFVFAIAGEQFGFVGVVLVVLAFGFLVARGLKVAHAARDGHAYLTAVAVSTMIGVYAFLNLAMVSSLVPVMGLPLPFVSWGGTALLTNMIGVGVLLNVARSVRRPRRVDARWQGARA